MIEILLDTKEHCQEARVKIDAFERMLALDKSVYKPHTMTIKSQEAWKTEKQNRAFHSLLSCYWRSGCCSAKSYDELRNGYKYKIKLIDHFLYVDDKYQIQKVHHISEIPKNLPNDRKRIILGSLSDATAKQMQEAIDLLITDCYESGVNTSKLANEFETIIKGMEKENE